MFRRSVVMLTAALTLAACDDKEPAGLEAGVTFVVAVADETFRVHTADAGVIAEARALLASGGEKNVSGTILRGNGGFNSGYSWHIKPQTLHFADLTIELCDGRPSYVEENVDYYVDTVKQYCPWGVKILSEVGAS